MRIDTALPTIFHVHDPALLYLAVILKKLHFVHAKIVYDRHEVYESPSAVLGIKVPKIARMYEIRASDHVDGVIYVSENHNESIHKLFSNAVKGHRPYPKHNRFNRAEIVHKIKSVGYDEIIKLTYVGS